MTLASFADTQDSDLELRLMNIESEDEYGEPIVHMIGRDKTGQRHHVEVEGHSPSFFIHNNEYTGRTENNPSIRRCESGYQDIHGEPLVRVYTYSADDVKEVKKAFDRTWEADVNFTHRFLIDNEIYTGFKFDKNKAEDAYTGDYRIHVSDLEPCESPEIEPRVVTIDIEVIREDGGFPHAEKAEWPVVTIVAHDSYTDEYVGWLLYHDMYHGIGCGMTAEEMEAELNGLDGASDMRVFSDEQAMLNDFNWWVRDQQPDMLSGWYSSGFDFPYLVNRCDNLNIFSHRDWSPFGQVWVSNSSGEAGAKGVTLFDMLDGYKKTQIHKLKSYKLENVAQEELGRGKIKMQEDFADMWKKHPVELMEYNIRDVEAVIEIDNSAEVIPMFSHMRDVCGTEFDQMIGNNINMIDMLTLREAKNVGIRLPTAVKPDEDWYFGAYVFTPKAGLHEKVVYPDLSSLYPNMMYQCNMSPETIVGTKADLFMSEYSEEDCVWSYIDPRPVKRVEQGEDYSEYKDGEFKAIMRRKKDGTWKTVWKDSPEPVKLYYLKPEVKQGFVSSLVGKLLDMKMEYKGSEKYEAVKRVVNSVYGVFGDSNSFGTGFRLFDWRMAESITLGGRKVIQYSADEFVNHLNQHKDAAGFEGADAELVGGDTDSVMTAIPFAEDAQQATALAEEAAEHVNQMYSAFCYQEFGLEEHAMEIEVESYSPRCFFVQDDKEPKGVGTKKRYVTKITVEDGEELDEPKFNIKGFEAIRSDQSQVTIDIQKYAFRQLMDEDVETAKQNINAAVRELYANPEEIDLEDLGVPFGMSKDAHQYGSENRKPMPWFKGAKYANQHIYGEKIIKSDMGDKPIYFYVEDTGNMPSTYTADTAEDGTAVDCIAVKAADDVPDEITVDRLKMLDKAVEKKLKPIYDTLDWDWDVAKMGEMNPARFM